MKSPMVMDASYIKDKDRYSDLKVMCSGAGWYVGTVYDNPDGYNEPGSRDSGYFASKAEAAEFLRLVTAADPGLAAQLLLKRPGDWDGRRVPWPA